MRCMKGWCGGAIVSLVASLGSFLGVQGGHGGGFPTDSGSVLGGLISDSDLESRTVGTEQWNDPSRPTLSVKSLTRQSVPDQNRASHYRLREVFAHSKVVTPLLVVDLEPQSLLYVRPMSGRSVGAAPAARWTRAVSIVEVAPESSR